MDTLSKLLGGCKSPTTTMLTVDSTGTPLDTSATMPALDADYDSLLGCIAVARDEILRLQHTKQMTHHLQELGAAEIQTESFFINTTLTHLHTALGATDTLTIESFDQTYTEELLAKAIIAGGKKLVELGAKLAMHMLSKANLLKQALAGTLSVAVFEKLVEFGASATFAFHFGDKEKEEKEDDKDGKKKDDGVYFMSPKSLKCVLDKDGEKVTLMPTSSGLYGALKKYNEGVPKILKELDSTSPNREGLLISLADLTKGSNNFQWRGIEDTSKQKLDIDPKAWISEISKGNENMFKLQKKVEQLSKNPEKPALDIAKSSYDALYVLCADCATWLKLVAD